MWHNFIFPIGRSTSLVKASLSLLQILIDLPPIRFNLPLLLFQIRRRLRLLVEKQLLDQLVVDGRPLLIATATLDVRAALLYLGRRQ